MIYGIISLIVAIIMHEIGHYIIAKYYGINPKIKVNWGSIKVESVKFLTLKPKQYINILLAGFIIGLIFLNPDPYLYIIYIAISSHDISNIMTLQRYYKSDKTIHQINKDDVFRIEKEINKLHNAI